MRIRAYKPSEDGKHLIACENDDPAAKRWDLQYYSIAAGFMTEIDMHSLYQAECVLRAMEAAKRAGRIEARLEISQLLSSQA